MKRRLIVGLLFVVFALSLALAACANNDTPPIVTEWQSDANGHRPKGTDVSETVAHVWDVGAVTTPATTTAEGVMKYTCTVCGFMRAESIPKLVPLEIAVVTDIGHLNDGGFNQGTFEGVKSYCEINNKG